jgi:hypothetical protein
LTAWAKQPLIDHAPSSFTKIQLLNSTEQIRKSSSIIKNSLLIGEYIIARFPSTSGSKPAFCFIERGSEP